MIEIANALSISADFFIIFFMMKDKSCGYMLCFKWKKKFKGNKMKRVNKNVIVIKQILVNITLNSFNCLLLLKKCVWWNDKYTSHLK